MTPLTRSAHVPPPPPLPDDGVVAAITGAAAGSASTTAVDSDALLQIRMGYSSYNGLRLMNGIDSIRR